MIIGCDIDGVLADFNGSFMNKIIEVTGKDLFPPRPFEPATWNYPRHFGYSNVEVSAVWENIKASGTFWSALPPYPETIANMRRIADLVTAGHDVYFITSRPGRRAKAQTEQWLASQTSGLTLPLYTVMISDQKYVAADAVQLEYYVDDKIENARDVHEYMGGKTQSYLLNREWNRGHDVSCPRIHSLSRFLDLLPQIPA